MKYSIKTFGCKVNTYDSALIQKTLNPTGYEKDASSEVVPSSGQGLKDKSIGQPLNPTVPRVTEDKVDTPSVHIVNTCAVTEEAVKSAQSYIRNYRKKNPLEPIVVTGCAAQVETEKFSSLKEVDMVVGKLS